jgi:hypothetical protein
MNRIALSAKALSKPKSDREQSEISVSSNEFTSAYISPGEKSD